MPSGPPRHSADPPYPPPDPPPLYDAPAGPRLLDRVRGAIRARHYSRRTEKAYVAWIRRYVLFHGKRRPAEMRTSSALASPRSSGLPSYSPASA